MGVFPGQGPLLEGNPLPRRDLIAEGRTLLDTRPDPGRGDFERERASTALAYGVLALAEQFRRFIDLIEKTEGNR